MPETYSNVIKDLEEGQSAENDNRKAVREADLFLNKRDGQWEPYMTQAWDNRPRYTFDQCNPIVDGIMGEMESMDFAISIRPSGGGATKDLAETYTGIIRNLENISEAKYTYNSAGRVMVGTGLAGWRVVQKYRDSDSHQQDLMIQQISNFKDRVWFDSNAVKQNMSDAEQCWVLTSMTMAAYLKKWPKGSRMSVGQDREAEAYFDKKSDEVVVGEYYKKKYSKRELVLMNNGAVYVVDDDFNFAEGLAVLFELAKELGREGNILVHEGKTRTSPQELEAQWLTLVELAQVFGLEAPGEDISQESASGLSDAEIEALIQQRSSARKRKDFAEGDRIRDELNAQGITLIDQAGGVTRWHRN